MAWATFCISTYKRPDFLKNQIELLLKQAFIDFEIVISDNDPNASGEKAIAFFNDNRIKYYKNGTNLGMIDSFNKSINRAVTDYIVMVTDDDPIDTNFLEQMFNLQKKYPNHSIYGGFKRKNKKKDEIEIIAKDIFIQEILNNNKTPKMLWSSCLLEKNAVLKVGGMPNYGSPHLADHALLALVGNEKGGVIVNRMYSSLTSHNNNYSKKNLDSYYIGCTGFYEYMISRLKSHPNFNKEVTVIIRHLQKWFIANTFHLKKYYTLLNPPDKDIIIEINSYAKRIMKLPFMKNAKYRYFIKGLIFYIKMKIK